MSTDIDRIIDSLPLAACRRLLKTGRPLQFQPDLGMGAREDRLLEAQEQVRRRRWCDEITDAQIIKATEEKPRSTAITKRCTDCVVRDKGRARTPTIALYPDGTVAVRLEGCQTTEYTTVPAIYAMAVKQRVAAERADRARAKKARKL